MTVAPPALLWPVAVLAERRPGATPWQDHVWRVAAVLEAEVPPVPPWTLLRTGADGTEVHFAGAAEVALFRSDTPNYKENLEAAEPRIWVALRPEGAGLALQTVTVDPGEAEVLAGAPGLLLEALPLPPGLAAALAAFVAEHHVERAFHKRRRDRADTEALGRQRPE